MIVKDNAYYWDHPDEYKRLTADDLQNEPTVYLCEFVLSGLREEMEDVIDQVNQHPSNEDCISKAQRMKHTLFRLR